MGIAGYIYQSRADLVIARRYLKPLTEGGLLLLRSRLRRTKDSRYTSGVPREHLHRALRIKYELELWFDSPHVITRYPGPG